WLTTLRQDHNDQTQIHQALTTHVNQASGEPDWTGLHQQKNQRTTTIPTYPFKRQELGVPAAADRGSTATSAVSHPLFDRHYEHRSEGQ
ncbi:acyltransferase, partial [Streptomyces sp. 549]|nr:acyltransferase [Streptomyces sp. 549]